jgi:glutathione peroxidase
VKTTLEGYKGKVLLIVNVASKCGLTPQYEQLEALQTSLQNEGFTVLGFPCNQFLGQEPGSEEEIKRSAARPTASRSRCSAKST